MEKIAVETEIWPADVKYAEEITEATPPSGMPMVMRILLDVQEVQEVQEKNIVREAMLKMSATECMKLLYKNEPLGKRIVAATKIIFGR